jgi:hypothetical protein
VLPTTQFQGWASGLLGTANTSTAVADPESDLDDGTVEVNRWSAARASRSSALRSAAQDEAASIAPHSTARTGRLNIDVSMCLMAFSSCVARDCRSCAD